MPATLGIGRRFSRTWVLRDALLRAVDEAGIEGRPANRVRHALTQLDDDLLRTLRTLFKTYDESCQRPLR